MIRRGHPLPLGNPATGWHSPGHSPTGTPLARLPTTGRQEPLTAGEYEVSGSLSSPSRGAFHLSLTVLVHYRSLKVFSLGGWSPLLPTNSPGFVVLRMPARAARLPLPDSHRLGWRFPTPSGRLTAPAAGPTTPVVPVTAPLVWAAPASLATTTGISFDFSSSGY